MRILSKIKKNELLSFSKDLEKKVGKGLIIYTPKILTKKIIKNKTKNIEIKVLGDYVFCFHNKFSDINIFNKIKYCKGLKHLLIGYSFAQNEIQKFINLCKKFENNSGFLKYDFFKLELNKKYEVLSGPLFGQVVEILNYQKNKIDLALGNVKASIKKDNLLFKPI